MYRIAKEYHFSSSHQLDNLPSDHPCARLHGHNYVVDVELAANQLNKYGFVRDYRDLESLKSYLDDKFDHLHLNDVLDEPPTAENLAKHLYEWCSARWPETVAVRISETPKTWAEFRP